MNFLSKLAGVRREAIPPTLHVSGTDIPLVLVRNARARRISLRLCAATRSIRLTLPPRASARDAIAFAQQNAAWLERQLAVRWPTARPFEPGSIIPFGDTFLLLESSPARRTTRIGDRLLVNDDQGLFASRVTRWLKAEALRALDTSTRGLAEAVERPVSAVRVGDPSSRWGSCAKGAAGGRIAYSWRLVMAPTFVQQSVVAHEVAHLIEANHGPAFWHLATRLLGTSHQPARDWLRANGPALHALGAPLVPRQA